MCFTCLGFFLFFFFQKAVVQILYKGHWDWNVGIICSVESIVVGRPCLYQLKPGLVMFRVFMCVVQFPLIFCTIYTANTLYFFFFFLNLSCTWKKEYNWPCTSTAITTATTILLWELLLQLTYVLNFIFHQQYSVKKYLNCSRSKGHCMFLCVNCVTSLAFTYLSFIFWISPFSIWSVMHWLCPFLFAVYQW